MSRSITGVWPGVTESPPVTPSNPILSWVPTNRAVLAGAGLLGGGTLADDLILQIDPAFTVSALLAGLVPAMGSALDGYVLTRSGSQAVWATPFETATNIQDLKLDFGAVGDGVADDLSAFNAAVAAGGYVFVPRGTYYISDTVHINNTVWFLGENRRISVVRSAPGKTAFIIHGFHSGPGGTGNGADSVIENLGMLPTGAVSTWSAGATLAVGDIRRPTVNPKTGLVFRVQSITTGITAGSQPTWPTDYATTVVDGGVTWVSDWAAAVWMRGTGHVRGLDISGFAGHGLQIYASTAFTPPTNANEWSGHTLIIQSCLGDGIFTQGGDANRGHIMNSVVGSNAGWGVNDKGFLGNKWTNLVSQSNGSGGYWAANTVGRSTFTDCYSESDEPPSQIITPAIVVGGLFGNGFTSDSASIRLHDGAWRGTTTIYAGNATDGYLETVLSRNEDAETLAIWKALDASANGLSGADLHFKYSRSGGTAGMFRYDIANSNNTIPALIATSQQANHPQGLWLFPLGIGLGSPELSIPAYPVMRASTAPPVSGTFKAGDFYWNSGADTAILGWKCTVAGTPGTWVAVSPGAGSVLAIDRLTATSTSGTAITGIGNAAGAGVKGTSASATGVGILAEATATARALQIQAPASAAPAAVRWTPQSTLGALAHLVGDAYMSVTGVAKICTASGTPGTFTAATEGPLLNITAASTTLNLTQANGRWSNRGASTDILFTLPASASLTVGDKFSFRVSAAFYLKVQAAGTDIIQYNNLTSVAAGFIRSNAKGCILTIEYQGSGEFFVTSAIGTWSVDL